MKRINFEEIKRRGASWLEEGRRRELWLWVLGFCACGALAFAWDRANAGDAAQTQTVPISADVSIPAGFVLVPIQVSNFESLDSILGLEGVVDLFLPSADGGGRARKVAERVRILRSPVDASHFAVLIPEAESRRLVSQTGAFFVAVQNPRRSHGAAFEDDQNGNRNRSPGPTRKPRSRIQVENPDASYEN